MDLSKHYSDQRRRTKARQKKIELQLHLASLLEPTEGGKDQWWSERQWIEDEIANLDKVIEEPVA